MDFIPFGWTRDGVGPGCVVVTRAEGERAKGIELGTKRIDHGMYG